MYIRKIPSLYKYLTESKQQDLLKKYLKLPETQKIWSKLDGQTFNTNKGTLEFDSADPNNWFTIRTYLMSQVHGIMHENNDKYQLGIGRLYTELIENYNPDQEASFNNDLREIIKAIKDTEFDDYDFKGRSLDALKSEFQQKIKEFNEEEVNSLNGRKYDNTGYTVRLIHNFKESRIYYKYVNDLDQPWCVTQNQTNWDGYSSNGLNAIYYILKDGFDKLKKPKQTQQSPYDEYGLSMIFLSVAPSGYIQNITSRWNHDCKNPGSGQFEGYGESADHYFEKDGRYDTDLFSKIIGNNVYEVCKPYSFEELTKDINITYLRGEFFDILSDKNERKFIIVDKDGNLINGKSIYKFIFQFQEGLSRVKKNGKWGFIDKTGKEAIPCIYDGGFDFIDGLAVVEKNDKWGVIDKTGKEVTPCVYDFVNKYKNGIAYVEKNGKEGFIDKTGKEVVPCIYDEIITLNDGSSRVRKNGKCGIIDKTGKEVIPCIYDTICHFPEFFHVKMNGKWGIMDETGKEVAPCVYDETNYSFDNNLNFVLKNGKWGIINKTGKWYDEKPTVNESLNNLNVKKLNKVPLIYNLLKS